MVFDGLKTWFAGEQKSPDTRPPPPPRTSSERIAPLGDLYLEFPAEDAATTPTATPRPDAPRRRVVVAKRVPIHEPKLSASPRRPSSWPPRRRPSREAAACEFGKACAQLAAAVDAACEHGANSALAASRRTDTLALSAPAEVRRLCDDMAALAASDPAAVARLIELDAKRGPEANALERGYGAAARATSHTIAWLSFNPVKRGFALSMTAQGLTGLALKYDALLREALADCAPALAALEELRGRLPVRGRTVRFSRVVGGDATPRARPESAEQPPLRRRSSSSSLKFPPGRADDFLTDAVPMGRGWADSALFACREGGERFFTSDPVVAEGAEELARTIVYQDLEDARRMCFDEGDAIWAADVDGRRYFYCVLEDDRGLPDLLTAGGAELRLDVERIE
mmetsp:Transcript_22249/g.66786  ORF Transcript_22249/g.66786 Transcript_22249/m.66786 type:complete len:399 (+) Transcript_22249:287-1483(+)